MALLVLLSTMSFTVEMHYCGDTLVDVAILHKAESCGMEKHDSVMVGSIEKCCDDQKVVIEGQDELKISFDDFTFDQQLFVASFVYSYIDLFEGLEENLTSYRDYAPPLVIRQIYKLDESYLI